MYVATIFFPALKPLIKLKNKQFLQFFLIPQTNMVTRSYYINTIFFLKWQALLIYL